MGKGKLEFKPFYIDEKVVEKYVEWFNKAEYKDILYEGTPKTKSQVEAWIISMIEDKSKKCYFVFEKKRLLGDIEISSINCETKIGQVHSFFGSFKDWTGAPMRESLKFIIEKAREIGLNLLGADFGKDYKKLSKPFIKNGFVQDLQASHYFTLRLNSSK